MYLWFDTIFVQLHKNRWSISIQMSLHILYLRHDLNYFYKINLWCQTPYMVKVGVSQCGVLIITYIILFYYIIYDQLLYVLIHIQLLFWTYDT